MDAAADRFGLSGTTLAGRYRVERQVAEGGFAVVYRAVQIALDRPIALKVLKTPPGLTDAARARFEHRFATEARTIGKLQHPYIVDVHDYGVSPMPLGDPAPWMALEWLEGETLEHELDRRRGAGGRNVAETVALLRPVIEAVAYAHKRGVVHRDIKPANIMIVDTDTGPMLRMLDFGIAKIMEGDPFGDTRPGRGSGASGFSPDYAAPEQITYSRTGPWTDVHALGLLLTELLTDEPPFSAARDEQLFEQIMSVRRPTPNSRGANAGGLEKVVARALALSPGQRWKDAGQLLAAVDARAGGAAPRRHASARRLQRRLLTTATALLASRPWRRARETWRVRAPARSRPCRCRVGWRFCPCSRCWCGRWRSGGSRPRGGSARATSATNVPPWIVPIPACASEAATGASEAATGMSIEPPPTAGRRPSPGAAADPHPIRRGRPARRPAVPW